MSWTFEIGQGDLRAYVTSMDGGGAPYRMTVTRPGGAGSLWVGLRSVAAAVETFCTSAAAAGQPVPLGARAQWEGSASVLDGVKGAKA